MRLAIISVPRAEVNFVYQSLLSLFTMAEFPGEVHIFVGMEDDGYLRFLDGSPRVIFHRMGADDWRSIAGWGLHRRHTYNYWKCLDHFARLGEGLCLCEDDVLYDHRFWPKLAETVGEMDDKFREYVLALYSEADYGGNPDLLRGRLVSAYPASHFFGTQGMYFPPTTIGLYADYLRSHGLDREGKPTDLLIGDLCNELQNVYLARSSLVQHIGRISTGLGFFHSSPSFGRPWPAEASAR